MKLFLSNMFHSHNINVLETCSWYPAATVVTYPAPPCNISRRRQRALPDSANESNDSIPFS